MSLNTAHANGGVLIHAGESILLFAENVEIDFHGKDEATFKGRKKGKLYLTTHRMIFNNKHMNDTLASFSFPFVTLSQVELEQPVFGANYIKGKVRAQPNGNWVGEAKFELHFNKGGAIEFGQAMLRTAQMGKSHKASSNNTGPDQPPAYAPPPSAYYQAPPPAYAPAPNGYYGWAPPFAAFPNQPPANTVYMTDMPPPYPGINGYAAGYSGYAQPSAPAVPTQQPAPSKEQEAAQSAYYDPSRPNCAYVPPPAYYEPPPSYQDHNGKKND
uniref:WW domain-binding protein 2 n=1 Tax=Cacopsylla melanoneura TaxID=428564 RepID=A0A8D8S595_9HEMI